MRPGSWVACQESPLSQQAKAFSLTVDGLVRAFHLLVSRTSTGDGCLFLLEPRAFDLKPMKINFQKIIKPIDEALQWRNWCILRTIPKSGQEEHTLPRLGITGAALKFNEVFHIMQRNELENDAARARFDGIESSGAGENRGFILSSAWVDIETGLGTVRGTTSTSPSFLFVECLDASIFFAHIFRETVCWCWSKF